MIDKTQANYTFGLVVTTDGSISDISREECEEAEERVIGEGCSGLICIIL